MNGHIKGLDALRAIAVLMVMISHFFEGSSFIYSLNLGHFGVMLFFMLSGFLISRIILNEKRKNTPLKTFLKAFYARRALRIFPLFYLAIGVFSILGIGFGDFIWWHITYTTNFLLAKIGSGFMGTHFWSLAVEEQFYLLYPAVLFAIPRKSERKLLVSLCLIGISSRYYFWNIQPELANYDRLLHTNWDCLCLGGILALVDFRKPFQRSIRTILPLGLLACSLLIYGNGLTQKHLLVNLFFAGIIFNILKNQDSAAVTLLEIPPLKYIAKISYGLYVWHYLLWQNIAVFEPLTSALNMLHPILQFGHSERMIIASFSFIFAIASWHLFESPILSLKQRFSYS